VANEENDAKTNKAGRDVDVRREMRPFLRIFILLNVEESTEEYFIVEKKMPARCWDQRKNAREQII